MNDHEPRPAVLNEDQVHRVQQFEHDLGDDSVVIAYAKTLEPAELTPEQLDRLRKIEQELGVYLVAWKRPDQVCA